MKYDIDKVTPRPWRQGVKNPDVVWGEPSSACTAASEHDAAHIVNCVNHHEQLVAMLEVCAFALSLSRGDAEKELSADARALLEKVNHNEP